MCENRMNNSGMMTEAVIGGGKTALLYRYLVASDAVQRGMERDFETLKLFALATACNVFAPTVARALFGGMVSSA